MLKIFKQFNILVFCKEIKRLKTDTEKILYILYEEEGLDRKNITENLLSPSPLSPLSLLSPLEEKGQEGQEGQEGQGDNYIKQYENVKKYLIRLLNEDKIVRDESSKPYKYNLSYEVRKLISEEIKKFHRK